LTNNPWYVNVNNCNHMEPEYIERQVFDKTDFSVSPFKKGIYEQCVFNNCLFPETDISGSVFSACKFTGCNMSMAKLVKTAFTDVAFKDCKLLGMQFTYCSDFALSFSFDNCMLGYASFHKLKMKKTLFKRSILRDVDFTEANLTSTVFDDCDFTDAKFEHTVLEKADFRTSYNYSFDPEKNQIKKAKFSLANIIGLLTKYDIEIEGAL